MVRQYDRFARPVKNHLTQTKVDMRITINEFVDLDTSYSMLITDAWFHISWKDEFLAWDPNDYQQLKQIHVNPAEIWKPDIVLINSADQENIVNVFSESDILVNSTGDVTWITMGLLHSKCPVWAYDYPFTIRPVTCQLTFCSLIYQSHEVNITTAGSDFYLAGPWVVNPKLQVINITGDRYEKFYDGYGTYSFETLAVKLRRRNNALPMLVKIPTLASITMVLCMFFLPVTWSVRIHLALFAILIQLLLIMYIGLQLGANAIGLARPISYLRDDLFLSSLALLITLIFRRLLVLADSMPDLPYIVSSLLQGPFAKFFCFGINESEYTEHTYSHNLVTSSASKQQANKQYQTSSFGSSLLNGSFTQPRGGGGGSGGNMFSIDHVALINEDNDPADIPIGTQQTSTSQQQQQQSSGNNKNNNNSMITTSSASVPVDIGNPENTIKVPIISHSQREWMLLIIFSDRLLFAFYALIMVPRLL